MKERYGWSVRTIAENAGLSHSTVNLFFRPHTRVGWDSCVAVARVFATPERNVLEMAELLSPEPPDTQDTRLLNNIYQNLNEDDRRDLIAYAEYLRDGRKNLTRYRGRAT
ncbi:MAG: hypothetical protein KJ063_02280 [Anaerolineae bacterium]|nr:hypothetical protein [Anaerolineae bacterium]